MRNRDLNAPNLDIVHEPPGRSRRFLEDPPMSVDDDGLMGDVPSVPERLSRTSAVFLFLFMIVVGTGSALFWRYYGDQATDLISGWGVPGATSSSR